jgi:hypothetical protein
MFRVRHCRVTSLASGMLRMMLEGHTLSAPPRPVNVDNAWSLGVPFNRSRKHRTSLYETDGLAN